jgi:tetratricopeptide (TPR) repeat protein/DNA-binding CsgD family transcriptional regulator
MKYFNILSFILFFLGNITANTQRDSLFRVYNQAKGNDKIYKQITYACYILPPESTKAIALLNDAIFKSQQNSYVEGEIRGNDFLGWYYFERLGDQNNAIKYYQKALKIAKENQKNDAVYGIYLHLTDVYLITGDNIGAINIIHESKAFSEKTGKIEQINYHNIQLLECYSNIGDFKKAYMIFREGLAIAQKNKDKHALWSLYTGIADTKNKEHKVTEALSYIEKAIEIGKENEEYYAILNFQAKVELLIQLNRLDEAEKLCIQIQDEMRITPAFDFVGSTNAALGLIHIARKNYPKALFYTLASYKEVEPTNNNTNLMVLDSTLSKIYFQLGEYRKSVESLRHHIKLKDQLYSEKNIREFQNLQHQFELEKNQLEIEKAEFSKKIYLILSVILLLALGLGVIVFFIKQKNNLLNIKLLDETSKNEEQKREQMQFEMDNKIRELTSMAMIADQKNVLWQNVKQKLQDKLKEMPTITENDSRIIFKIIEQNTDNKNEWDTFKIHFEQVHPQFFKTLSNLSPNLTSLELRQCAYIKINLTPKQVGNLLNITTDAVKKSRMRIKKKFNLSAEDSLGVFIDTVREN